MKKTIWAWTYLFLTAGVFIVGCALGGSKLERVGVFIHNYEPQKFTLQFSVSNVASKQVKKFVVSMEAAEKGQSTFKSPILTWKWDKPDLDKSGFDILVEVLSYPEGKVLCRRNFKKYKEISLGLGIKKKEGRIVVVNEDI